jgi:hypothetical protein
MDIGSYINRYRVVEVLHAPMPYVHEKEPMVRETLHLLVQRERGRMVSDV